MQRWGLVACASLLLVSCEEESAPAKAPTAAKSANAAPLQPANVATPPAATPTDWAYSSVGKRDPFESYLANLKEQGLKPSVRKVEETEKFELNQYRLTGLVTGTAQPSAMVEDPTNKGHTLHIGSRIGKNGGRVTRITATGIVVIEENKQPTGERIKVPIEIILPKPEVGFLDEP